MNHRICTLSLLALIVSLMLTAARAAAPLGTGFAYQGQLKQGGAPANGNFDIEFRLFNAASLGNQVGNPVTLTGIDVTNGLFTVKLNASGEFGPTAFNGEQRWLQITVDGTTLTPRQALTAVPYAATSLRTVGGFDTHSLDAADGDPMDAVYVDNDGNVGVGTTLPTAQFDVNGATSTTTLEITGGSPLLQPLAGWGQNFNGQTDVPTGAFTAVAAGGVHSLAIRSDGTLVGWGGNDFGQINVPAGVFIALDAGYIHSLAIRSDGTLAGWGSNSYGKTDVPVGTFIDVAAGGEHSLAIRSDGTLVGWGYSSNGQTNVPSGTYTSVVAGDAHSLAIRSNGTLVGWGRNNVGQINVPAGTFVAIAAGLGHSLAIRSDGTLVGWGYNGVGQINVPSGTFTAVAAGGFHSLAIRNDGTLVGWGNNSNGQLNLPPGTFTALAAGYLHGLAIHGDLVPSKLALVLTQDSAFKPGTNTWSIASDRRLKTNIEPLTGSLDRLLQLRGVTFEWVDPASQGGITGTQMGLIADEVQRTFPQWVGLDPKGYQTLTVGGFEALTAEALRDLRQEKDAAVRKLQDENAELRELLKRASERLDALEGGR